MMARPTKLSPEITSRIMTAIQSGNDKKVAAAMAGIAEATFYRWLQESEAEDAPQELIEFRESVERAEAEAEVIKVAQISQAASNGNWKAASWWLERKHANRWGQTSKIQAEISGPNGSAISLSLEDDLKKAVLAFLSEGEGNGEVPTGTNPTEVTE